MVFHIYRTNTDVHGPDAGKAKQPSLKTDSLKSIDPRVGSQECHMEQGMTEVRESGIAKQQTHLH